MYCSITGANGAWMEAEVSLLEEYSRTSGPQEVYYRGPVLERDLSRVWSQESSDAGKEATRKRRKRMRDGINKYSLVQLRHVLMMKEKGGTSPPEVLFARVGGRIEQGAPLLERQLVLHCVTEQFSSEGAADRVTVTCTEVGAQRSPGAREQEKRNTVCV